MNRGILLGGGIFFGCASLVAQTVKPMPPTPMLTRWGKEVSAENVHPEYPRPTMVRTDWLNLNGQWDCAITHRDQTNAGAFDGRILVPFPVEATLSGMHRLFTEQQRLWYRRRFNIPPAWRGRRVLLHFEAVDWETKVWLNEKEQGTHRGGYDRFSFDITDALKSDGEQELIVSVLDPTDGGYQPRGKQVLHPRDLYYTSCSGIWQTVWLEPVPTTSIESLKVVPDIDAGVLKLVTVAQGETNGVTMEAVALDGTAIVGQGRGSAGQVFQIAIPNSKLWSPSAPFLYDLKVTLMRAGEKVDEVCSYFGMRQIAVAKDESGFPRLVLNHKRLFQLGPLDQGYWPDGIYTAPTDEALRWDIENMKQLGFNMCRKHMKIEPERWYYWCDKLGLLVWQDMPSGDRPSSFQQKEIQRRPESARQFETELKQMILGRGNHPCIVIWIPFNQGWGQYDTARIVGLIKELDPSRLVIDASGWYDFAVGDVRSLHRYPGPMTPEQDGKRPCVLGECGALGLNLPQHAWRPAFSTWNLTYYNTVEALTTGYETLMSKVQSLVEKNGLSGVVVTEWTDVETQVDGFMTYDREVNKIPKEKVRAINEKVINAIVEPAHQ